jgi:hypothetical protein
MENQKDEKQIIHVNFKLQPIFWAWLIPAVLWYFVDFNRILLNISPQTTNYLDFNQENQYI